MTGVPLRVISNTIIQHIQLIIQFAVSFLITNSVLKVLGKVHYGIYILVS